MFQAIQHHVLPRPDRNQALSLAYVEDFAEAVVTCLTHPVAVGKTYFVAAPEIVTGQTIAVEIAQQMNCWTVPLPLPPALLWSFCAFHQVFSRVTGQAGLLNLQKYAELRAAGWVCSPQQILAELGLACPTSLKEGIGKTLSWYRQERWL